MCSNSVEESSDTADLVLGWVVAMGFDLSVVCSHE